MPGSSASEDVMAIRIRLVDKQVDEEDDRNERIRRRDVRTPPLRVAPLSSGLSDFVVSTQFNVCAKLLIATHL